MVCSLFSKTFNKNLQSVKWFKSRSGWTLCLSLSGSKLFVNIINYQQTTKVAARQKWLLTRKELKSLKRPLKKKTKNCFSCLMQVKSIAGCSTCIKLPFVFKNFILSIFEWPLKTGLTVNVILVFIVSSSNESSDNRVCVSIESGQGCLTAHLGGLK